MDMNQIFIFLRLYGVSSCVLMNQDRKHYPHKRKERLTDFEGLNSRVAEVLSS